MKIRALMASQFYPRALSFGLLRPPRGGLAELGDAPVQEMLFNRFGSVQ